MDKYFRTWSGSTQVNAEDLRKLRYPTMETLRALGGHIGDTMPEQELLDHIVESEVS